jgi:hypothetical protein
MGFALFQTLCINSDFYQYFYIALFQIWIIQICIKCNHTVLCWGDMSLCNFDESSVFCRVLKMVTMFLSRSFESPFSLFGWLWTRHNDVSNFPYWLYHLQSKENTECLCNEIQWNSFLSFMCFYGRSLSIIFSIRSYSDASSSMKYVFAGQV